MSRILLHSLVFSPDSVSTSHIVTELALELKRLGHEITVLTTTPHYNIDEAALQAQPLQKKWSGLLYYSQCHGIPVWHVKMPMKGNKIWARAFDYIRFHIVSLIVNQFLLPKQDMVITNSPPLTIGLIGSLLAFRWQAKSIYVVQELYPDIAINRGLIRGSLLIKFVRWLETLVYRYNTHIVTITEEFKHIIASREVSFERISFIPNGVDCEAYCPVAKNNAFVEANGLGGQFIVMYAGNIGLMQDWESVVFAAEHLSDCPIKFVVVGEGMRRQWLVDRIKQLKLNNLVIVSYQSKGMMPSINASADIMMVPMTDLGLRDGFPSKIYSSLASAKPVIVSAQHDSEMGRLIRMSGCGRIVIPGDHQSLCDAVLKAYREKSLLEDEGRNGRAFILKYYAKQIIAERYDSMIKNL